MKFLICGGCALVKLSKVQNLYAPGKGRTRLVCAVVVALREFMQQSEPDEKTRDLAVFNSVSLEEISSSIDSSVLGWEKRGYWVKADRFRMEWAWAGKLGVKMHESAIVEDWANVALIVAKFANKVGHVKVSQHHRMGKPWIGARKKLH